MRVAEWIKGAGTEETREARDKAEALWADYCKEEFGGPIEGDINREEMDKAVAGFLVYLVDDMGSSPNNARTVQGRLLTMFGLQGVESPSGMPLTKLARAALLRRVPAPKSVAAFTSSVFFKLLEVEAMSGWADRHYLAAAYCLTFYCMFRVSEVSIPSAKRLKKWLSERGLFNRDLTFFVSEDGRQPVTIFVKWRKNDERGRGLSVTLYAPWDSNLPDPVAILKRVHKPHRPNEMLLRERRSRTAWRPMRADWIRTRLKASLAKLDLDPRLYSSHSLRASGASALMATGLWTAIMICEMGGWRSMAMLRYLRAVVIHNRDAVGDIGAHWSRQEQARQHEGGGGGQ